MIDTTSRRGRRAALARSRLDRLIRQVRPDLADSSPPPPPEPPWSDLAAEAPHPLLDAAQPPPHHLSVDDVGDSSPLRAAPPWPSPAGSRPLSAAGAGSPGSAESLLHDLPVDDLEDASLLPEEAPWPSPAGTRPRSAGARSPGRTEALLHDPPDGEAAPRLLDAASWPSAAHTWPRSTDARSSGRPEPLLHGRPLGDAGQAPRLAEAARRSSPAGTPPHSAAEACSSAALAAAPPRGGTSEASPPGGAVPGPWPTAGAWTEQPERGSGELVPSAEQPDPRPLPDRSPDTGGTAAHPWFDSAGVEEEGADRPADVLPSGVGPTGAGEGAAQWPHGLPPGLVPAEPWWRRGVRRLLERWSPADNPGSPRWRLAALAVVGVVLGIVVAIGLIVSAAPETPETPEIVPALPAASASGADRTAGGEPSTAGGSMVISVVGKVTTPGLVTLPEGSRVADAIEAAGGPARGAELGGLNLARRLADGEQIYVGVPVPAGVDPGAAAPGAGADGAPGTGTAGSQRVDLNSASLTALDTLPGIGPVTAQRIIDWRTQNGRFNSVEQLREIEGIGPTRFARLKDLVVVW